MRAYYIAMTLRLLCVASLAFVRDWWIILPAAGAILLPYFAVMIGNAVGSREGGSPAALTPQAIDAPPADQGDAEHAGMPGLIIVDAPAERRASAAPSSDPTPTPPTVDGSEPRAEPGEAAQ